MGLGYFTSAAHHIGGWIGASQVFNVHPSTHPLQLCIHPVSISIACFPDDCHHSFHISIGEDVVLLASGVVFVDTGVHAHETASDMVCMMGVDGDAEQVIDAVT